MYELHFLECEVLYSIGNFMMSRWEKQVLDFTANRILVLKSEMPMKASAIQNAYIDVTFFYDDLLSDKYNQGEVM